MTFISEIFIWYFKRFLVLILKTYQKAIDCIASNIVDNS